MRQTLGRDQDGAMGSATPAIEPLSCRFQGCIRARGLLAELPGVYRLRPSAVAAERPKRAAGHVRQPDGIYWPMFAGTVFRWVVTQGAILRFLGTIDLAATINSSRKR